jgi:hypothetical protein
VDLLKSESITTGTGGAVRTLAEGYLVVVPKQRLEKFADLLADDGWTINASSLEGLAVLGVWAALGAVLFHYKRNLA